MLRLPLVAAAGVLSCSFCTFGNDACRPVECGTAHSDGCRIVNGACPGTPRAWRTVTFAPVGYADCCRPVPVCCRPQLACCVPQAPCAPDSRVAAQGRQSQADGPRWKSLFDGKTLDGWERSNFGGEGEVAVKEGTVLMEMGADLTGIHTQRTLPRMNYEVALDAQRVEGGDFFCGLTVPVRDDHCSLIVGGWGGGVCGLSSIDGLDASENDTTTYREFKTGQWYRVRLRVTGPRIQAWLDDERVVNQSIEGKKISIRPEVDPSLPFGIASWRTTAALREIRIRELSADEVADDAKAAAEE
ncbi:MAG: DUF1080 domain-containing protein [Planctomycetales bacterium]